MLTCFLVKPRVSSFDSLSILGQILSNNSPLHLSQWEWLITFYAFFQLQTLSTYMFFFLKPSKFWQIYWNLLLKRSFGSAGCSAIGCNSLSLCPNSAFIRLCNYNGKVWAEVVLLVSFNLWGLCVLFLIILLEINRCFCLDPRRKVRNIDTTGLRPRNVTVLRPAYEPHGGTLTASLLLESSRHVTWKIFRC